MGEIAAFGDTVRIITEPTITVSDYYRGSKVIPQDLDDSEITLVIDQAKYMAFKVDDIEDKQAHVNWSALATSSGAYTLKNDFDQAILTYMDAQTLTANEYGTTSVPIDVGYDAGEVSPLNVLSRLSRLLDEQDVPEENRWCVAAPKFWEAMADENSKLMGVDFTGDSTSKLRNGRITDGLIRGFRPYKTNNAVSGSGYDTLQAGHMSAVSTGSQIAKTELIRDNDSFADVVRGLHLYGRKALRTNALALCYYSID